MRISTRCICIGFLLVLLSCSPKSTEVSQIRLGQFMLADDTVTIHLTSDDQEQNETLAYGELTTFEKIKPGTYQVKVFSGSQPILNKKYSFGAGGKFTLFVYGKVGGQPEVNEETNNQKLHRIVSGSEAKTSNGFLPKLDIIDEHYQGSRQKAQVRWFNLLPFETPLQADVNKPNHIDLGAAAYGKQAKAQSLDPGAVNLSWYSGNKINRATHEQNLKAQRLYTFFAIMDLENSEAVKVIAAESDAE